MRRPDRWLPKSDLVDGAYYIGVCRNAYVAMWDAQHQQFFYIREKFGHVFAETIKHPEDDEVFDVFYPETAILRGTR